MKRTVTEFYILLQGMPLGARLAELTRLKLEYDSAKGTLKGLQHDLAELEERLSPEDLQGDRDRVMLIQEKENLLREFRSVRSYSHDPLQVRYFMLNFRDQLFWVNCH